MVVGSFKGTKEVIGMYRYCTLCVLPVSTLVELLRPAVFPSNFGPYVLYRPVHSDTVHSRSTVTSLGHRLVRIAGTVPRYFVS